MAKRTVTVTMAVKVNIPVRMTVKIDPEDGNGGEVTAVEIPMQAGLSLSEVVESMTMEELEELDKLALKAVRSLRRDRE